MPAGHIIRALTTVRRTRIPSLIASFAVAGVVASATSTAWAQGPEGGRLRLGSLTVRPEIAEASMAIDTNVFNEAQDPQGDLIYTVSPLINAGVDLPQLKLQMRNELEVVRFYRYADQRATNNDSAVRLELPVNRVALLGKASYRTARERPNSEIDVRPRRALGEASFGARVRLSGVSRLSAEVTQSRVDYRRDEEEEFEGQLLPSRLNRTERGARTTLDYALTPLTQIVLTGEYARTRFTVTPARNSESLRLLSGLRMDPSALVSGDMSVGMRTLTGPALPAFKGLIATGSLSYAVRPATSLSLHIDRDVAYSYRADTAYYLRTNWGGALEQRFLGSWSFEARGQREDLDYSQNAAGFQVAFIETIRRYGGSIGYTRRSNTRVQLDVEYRRRSSPFFSRTYRGIYSGLSASLAF